MHAWIAMAFGNEDNPYADEPSVAYVYDNHVQNHKRVDIGDPIRRDRDQLEGVGKIVKIEEA